MRTFDTDTITTGLVAGAMPVSQVCPVPAAAELVIDAEEHQRRVDGGLAAITRMQVMHPMMSFPYGLEVGWGDLTDREARFLASDEVTAAGAFLHSGTGVTRVWRPAVAEINQYVVYRRRWSRRALKTVGHCRQFSQVTLHLQDRPPELQLCLHIASSYGFGVSIGDPDAPEVLMPPAPWTLRCLQPIRWAVLEAAYTAWRAHIGQPLNTDPGPDDPTSRNGFAGAA